MLYSHDGGATTERPLPPEASLAVNPHVRARTEEGGAVLVDLFRGRYYSFNRVGASVWSELEAGHARAEIVDSLSSRFAVDRGRVKADVEVLLRRLLDLGLLTEGEAAAGRPRSTREAPGSDGSSKAWTETSEPPPFGRPGSLEALGEESREGRSRSTLPGTVASYLLVVGVDLVLRIAGFRRFHGLVRRFRVRQRSGVRSHEILKRAPLEVDSACRLYLKRAWCLQRSAVLALRLRWAGVPAELVIGVRRVPFLGHAWVEVGGSVVNDDPRVQRFYHALERC